MFKYSVGRLNLITTRNFCQKSGLTFKPNPENEDELIVTIPNDLASMYSFSNLDRLPLYENFKNTYKYSNPMPSPKLNMALMAIALWPSYETIFFQPLLLFTLFYFKKYLLSTNYKLVDIIGIDLLPDGESVSIKNYYGISKLDISETYLGDTIVVGGVTYYELKNNRIKYPVYINDSGRFLNQKLIKELFSGNYEKIKLEVQKIN
jgi:hypothetical protein